MWQSAVCQQLQATSRWSSYSRFRFVNYRWHLRLFMLKLCSAKAGILHFAWPKQLSKQGMVRSSSLTCSNSFQPSSFRRWQLLMLIMAAVATSAALPWTGVLIAALRACPTAAPVPGPFLPASGSCLRLPSSVQTYPCFLACSCCWSCHLLTCTRCRGVSGSIPPALVTALAQLASFTAGKALKLLVMPLPLGLHQVHRPEMYGYLSAVTTQVFLFLINRSPL